MYPKEGLVKTVHIVRIWLMLAGAQLLAQSGSIPLANQASRLLVASGLQPGAPQVSHGTSSAQPRGGRSRRRRAKPEVQNGTYQELYGFVGGNDGAYPGGGLIFDSSGNLYGTTSQGGGADACGGEFVIYGCGTVFELSPNSNGGWTETILYSFQGRNDGEGPSAGLIFDQAGNLYGTTAGGGSGGQGTVFELSSNSSGGWTEAVLYSFQGGSDGAEPQGLIFDGSGNLYGTTLVGGLSCFGGDTSCGTIFELSLNGNGGWTGTTIYSFPSSGSAGIAPNPGLIFDKSGNLYGTASQGGGTGCSGAGCGTAFELSPSGSGSWTETTLYSFQGGSDGASPVAALVFDQLGHLYGTAQSGGGGGCRGEGCGTVFELSPNGSGGWMETTLYSFQSGDGAGPSAGLIFDKSGNLYGTTLVGGDLAYGNGTGVGTVFELSPNGSGGWTESVLWMFLEGSDGFYPSSGVIFDQLGNLYGETGSGGGACPNTDFGCGAAFEVTKEPLVAFNPTNLSFGNQTVGIGSSPLAVALTNGGNVPLNITSILVTGANTTDFGQTNNCPSSMPPNTSCNINVTFTPTAGGNRSAGVGVTDNASGSPQSVPLTGVGVLPAVTLSPASLNFGSQTAGTTSNSQATTLTNTGLGILRIASIGITGSNTNEFAQTNNCPSSLPSNSSCNISVSFTPTALGNANASITIADSAPGSPQSVPLTGSGVVGISFSPPTVTFPSQYVGTSGLPQSLTLKNTGDAVLTITNVTASPSDFAVLSSCGASIPVGGNCSVGVFFDPTASGVSNGVLTITDSSVSSPQTVPLSGTGQDFSMAPSSPSTATVAPGQAANYAVAVAPGGGFNQTVTLTCSGAPAQSSCAVSPSSVKLNGAASTPVTVTVTTAGSSARLAYPSGTSLAGKSLALLLAFSGLPGLVLLRGVPRKWRVPLSRRLALLCLMSLVVTWSACGGGGSTGSGGGATPAGTYNLTVVGTFTSGSANLVHATKLTLVVQ